VRGSGGHDYKGMAQASFQQGSIVPYPEDGSCCKCLACDKMAEIQRYYICPLPKTSNSGETTVGAVVRLLACAMSLPSFDPVL
jgi:hypothetical protein